LLPNQPEYARRDVDRLIVSSVELLSTRRISISNRDINEFSVRMKDFFRLYFGKKIDPMWIKELVGKNAKRNNKF